MKLWIEEINEGVEAEEEKLEEGARLGFIEDDARFDRVLDVRGGGDRRGGSEEGSGGGKGRGSLEIVFGAKWGDMGFRVQDGSEEGRVTLTFVAD